MVSFFGIENHAIGIGGGIGIFIGSIVTWATLNVFANISLRLKSIQETMPLKLVDAMAKPNSPNHGQAIGSTETASEAQTLKECVPTKRELQKGDRVLFRTTKRAVIVEDVRTGEVYVKSSAIGSKREWLPIDKFLIPEE